MSTSSKRRGKSGSTSSKGSRKGSAKKSTSGGTAPAPMPPTIYAAWMTKQGHFFKTMRRRFFRLGQDGTLRYFKDDAASTPPLGVIDLTNSTLELATSKSNPFGMNLKVVDKKKPKWYFVCDSEEARAAWFDALARFSGVVNADLKKKKEEEVDPLQLALQDIDLGIKARPIDVEKVGKGLGWILNGLRELNALEPFDAQDPFNMNPDAAALLDVASLVCGLVIEHMSRQGGIWARPIASRVGGLMFYSSAFSMTMYPAIKENPSPEVAATHKEYLLRIWEDSITALVLTPMNDINLIIHRQVCQLVVKEKPDKRVTSLAKMMEKEVDALELWAGGKQTDKAAKVFGYLWVRSARWFGKTWKRRFFVLHQDSLAWYEKPNGKASGRALLKDVTSLEDGKPTEEHPWTLDLLLENGDKVEIDTALQMFHAYWATNLVGYIEKAQGDDKAIHVKDRSESIAIGGSMKVELDAMHSAGADTAAAAIAQRGR